MDLQRVSVGIAAAIGAETAARIAPAVEAAGFRGLWINETPGTDALEVAAAVARGTERLMIATGVIPVDRRPPQELLDELSRLDLPGDRFVLGIGSGAARTGVLPLMRDAIGQLRAADCAGIVVGALGPRMRRLAAEQSDGVVLNWLTPDAAADQSRAHHELDPGGLVTLYVRTAAEPDAVARLEEEAGRYGRIPSYAANFERLGFGPLDTTIGPGQAEERLAAYASAVDEVVLRAVVPDDDAASYLRFVDALAG